MRVVRRVLGWLVVLAVVAGVVWGVWLGVGWLATAVVERRSLEQRVVTRGVTGFVPMGEVVLAAGGRVTAVSVERGDVIEAGEVVASVDGRVLVAVGDGNVFWRDLVRGDRGGDVAALQGLLVESGFMEGEPDGRFGASTVAGWRRWQEAYGFAQVDGVFRMGDVVGGAWPVRVGGVQVGAGDFVSPGAVLTPVTSLDPGVTVELTPSARLRVAEGALVRVEVSATGLEAWGVLGSVAESPIEQDDGGLVFVGQVVLDDQLDAPEGTQAQVTIVTARVVDAVAVPLASVISVGSGEPVVRVVDGDGGVVSVPVVLGMSDGAWVEVVSGVEVGETVVVGASR